MSPELRGRIFRVWASAGGGVSVVVFVPADRDWQRRSEIDEQGVEFFDLSDGAIRLAACEGSLSAGVAGKLYVKSLRAGHIAQDGNRALRGVAVYESVVNEEGAVLIAAFDRTACANDIPAVLKLDRRVCVCGAQASQRQP